MKTYIEKSKAIAKKYPFSDFKYAAIATTEEGDAISELKSCGNHLDQDFMKLLEDGAQFDIKRVPL